MILHPIEVAIDRFLWQPKHNMLTAEISDLGRDFRFGQVYDDACDEGITVVSHHTGREVVYGVDHIERRDGDLLYWDLRPALASEKHLPIVRLFND